MCGIASETLRFPAARTMLVKEPNLDAEIRRGDLPPRLGVEAGRGGLSSFGHRDMRPSHGVRGLGVLWKNVLNPSELGSPPIGQIRNGLACLEPQKRQSTRCAEQQAVVIAANRVP